MHRFTVGELNLAIRLRERKIPWSDIADRIGCSSGSLQQTVSRYKRGAWSELGHKIPPEVWERIETMVGEGKGVAEMAALLGVSKTCAAQRLSRSGFTPDVRQEYHPY